MENTINYGIDLGTTNSAIAKFTKGEVEVFSNPLDYGKRTLPSVIAFRKNRVMVGDKAKTYLEKDGKNVASVVSVFKRKMGTTESYPIKVLSQSKTPIELSALILKQLKTFVPAENKIEAAVITIPASFDTIQSNATKEAGKQAGFRQVVLLQEPIAASLAYANKTKEKELTDGKWLVYDLGGGTFDVALVKIQDGEMKVLDHEGDNFLGGADFDRMIVENFVIPHLEKEGTFENLKNEMQSAKGKYNTLYYKCLHRAEEAKIELSARTSAEIEIICDDDEDEEIDTVLTITRSEFENLIKSAIDGTIEMVKKIITRNSLVLADLQFVLMVGGSTYIPYVRKRVAELIGTKVNTDIDPTTAVAVGAAFYAGTKTIDFAEKTDSQKRAKIKVKMVYEKATQEEEEYFAARIEGDINGLFYRIDRDDAGFTTGLKPLKKQIAEDLALVEKAYNFFTFKVYDKYNNLVETDAATIGINSGYSISGQPLPNDICIEIDDDELVGKTKLELVFRKNAILPLKKTLTKTVNKTVIKGSNDKVILNVLEGSHLALPASNKSIGFLEMAGNSFSRDLAKGSEIEITLEISESRDITASVYFTMLDQEFKKIFNPKERHVSVGMLNLQVEELSEELETEIKEAEEREDYETAKELKKLEKEMNEVVEETNEMADDDVTDKRYQLEDKKRKIAQEMNEITKDKRLQKVKKDYFEVKEKCNNVIDESGNDYERKAFNDIVRQENVFLNADNHLKIQEKMEDLDTIYMQILWRNPKFLVGLFKHLIENLAHRMNNQTKVKTYIDGGKYAIQTENWERLGEVNHALLNEMPRESALAIQNSIIGYS